MQCVHTSEANRHAYIEGLAQLLEIQEHQYINAEVNRILNSGYSDEYQDVIALLIEHNKGETLPKYDALIQKIISCNKIELLSTLQLQLRELLAMVAYDYVKSRKERLDEH